ncbi:MAG: lytic transglycosylase domain-containing protein [Deltaproteobacteria bacterium]|nr:lytic transglycosylase domain-containing protein [Deltaproteobacteria bacterium]
MISKPITPFAAPQKVEKSRLQGESTSGGVKKEGSFASILKEASSSRKNGVTEQPRYMTRKEQERPEIDQAVQEAAAKYSLPPELIGAVIQQESNFNSRAISPVGAEGLMQLMPATAREMGVKNSFDIRQNVDGGSRYLRQMMDRFDGDMPKAIAAYNAGPGAVERAGGIPHFEETQAYVPAVMKNFETMLSQTGGTPKNLYAVNSPEPTLVMPELSLKKKDSSSKEAEEPPPPPKIMTRV